MKTCLIFLLAFTISLPLLAQDELDTALVRTYGGVDDDVAYDIIETSDFGYLLFGTTSSADEASSNYYLIKINEDLEFEWSRVYGEGNLSTGLSITPDGEGNFYLVGYTLSQNGEGYDVLVYKIDFEGNVLWSETYGGSDWDFAYSSIPDEEGGLILIGETWSMGNGEGDVYILKISHLGEIIWEKTLGGEGRDLARDITKIEDSSSFYVAGSTYEDDLFKTLIALVDENGDSIWQVQYTDGQESHLYCVDSRSDSTMVLGGYHLPGDEKKNLMREINFQGEEQWVRLFSDPGNQIFHDLVLVENRIIGVGESDSFGIGGSSMYVINTDEMGFFIDGAAFGGSMDEKGYKVKVDSQDRLLFVGFSDSYAEHQKEFYLVRLPNTELEGEYILNLDSFFQDDFVTEVSERNISSDEFSIYPNPSRATINVQSAHGVFNEVVIFDELGHIVLRESFDRSHIKQINIVDLKNGAYTIGILHGHEMKGAAQLIKE